MKKLKLAVNSVASIVLVASTFLPVTPMFMGHAAAFSGSGEGGSSGNPFRITTCTQLQEMDDNLSAYYAIMNDIDCSGSASWTDGDGAGFSPIGRIPGGNFTGHLDGRNHTVSGLTINRPAVGYMGLFATLNDATVKNLNLTEVSIIGHGHLGALAGSVSGTTAVSNINVEGDIDGDETYIGGLIGSLWNGVTVSKVSFTGTVDGLQGIGGLAGEDLGAQISDSYANATVTAGAVAGGLVGFMGFFGNNASITRSYVVGSVSGSYKGGIVGITQGSGDLDITDSFIVVNTNGGSAIAGYDGDNPVNLTNNFFDQTAHESEQCVSGNVGVAGCTAVNTDGESPDLFKNNNTQAPLDGWDFDAIWVTTTGYPALRPGTPDTFDPISYTVTTCAELQAMQDDLTGNYTLDNNIDCSATSSWNGGEGFIPVGTDEDPFTGSLNGAGHRISGLYINRGEDNQGLFGVIEDGGVASLFMTGGSIQGLSNTGAVAGQVRGTGSVQQTASDVPVTGTGHFGGLVGWAQGSAVLQYVAAMGDVSGDGTVSPVSAGGLVGQLDDDSFLVNGYATGTITVTTAGDNFVGGVVGIVHDAAIANTYFSGTVSVPVSSLGFATAGGLVGVLDGGELNNSFNAGAVTGYALSGGLVGTDLDASSVTGLYLDVSRATLSTCFGYSDGDNLTESNCSKLNVADDNAEYFFGNSSNAPLDQWDFGGVWQALSSDFPIFTWQPIPGAYEPDHQYTITSCSQLQSIDEDLEGNYTLGADIDCSGTRYWNGGDGFSPIGGDSEGGFIGEFDGAGHTISNLYINRPGDFYVGLFAYSILPNIHDVTLQDATVIGDYYTGGLVGYAEVGEDGGTIDHVTITGLDLEGVQNIGGLVGYLQVSDNQDNPFYLRQNTLSYSQVTATNPSGSVGGMVGYLNWGYANIVITNNASGADVYAPDSYGVGGMFGFTEQWAYSEVTMQNLMATGDVAGYGNVGGLIGEIRAHLGDGVEVSNIELLRVSAEGDVEGYNIGGLIGSIGAENGMTISIRDSHTGNDVHTDDEDAPAGGLVGDIHGDDYSVFIRQSYAVGSVTNDSGAAGGLVGYSGEAISYIIDSVSYAYVVGAGNVGGLLGSGQAIIYDSYAAGTVTSSANWVGGLVGYLYGGRIQNSFSAAIVSSAPETDYVAGLVGRYDPTAVVLTGNGYDREVSGVSDCAYADTEGGAEANNDEDECAQRNGENSTPNWYKNNHANAPLDEWNFDDIWQTVVADYPALAEQPATQAPSEVQNLQVTGDRYDLQLSWDAPADNGGSYIVGYTVWASVHGWDWWQPVGFTTGTSLTVGEDDLTDSMFYDFRVLASNETSLSDAASELNYPIATRYDVATCEDLQAMADDLTGIYTLTADIDCSDTQNWNDGEGFVTIDNFEGQLHGRGHTISGLYIYRPGAVRQGLFSIMQGYALVEDLRLVDGSVTGDSYVGALAARMFDESIVRRVSSNLTVTGGTYVGGLVGDASGATKIQNSYVTGDVVATTGGAGGLVGYVSDNDSVIEFTYATGSVTVLTDEFGVDYVGGLVGVNSGAQIRNSFATGIVTPATGHDDYAGGLVGYDYDNGVYLTNNYYNATDNAYCVYAADDGLTDTEDCNGVDMLAHPGYFFGNHANAPLDTWNFTSVWMTVADGYPVFRPFGTIADDDSDDSGTGDHGTTTTTSTIKKKIIKLASTLGEALQSSATDNSGTDELKLDLDDFKEYTSGKGKKLTLRVGQVIHFTVVRGGEIEQHTATVKEVGDDYVIFTIHSTTFDVRVAVGETRTVVIDGVSAIKITLVSITDDGQVNALFSKVRVSSNTQMTSDGGFSWWWLVAAITAVGTVWLLTRRRHQYSGA